MFWPRLAAVILACQLFGCATNPVTGKQDFVLISEAEEIQRGSSYHQDILKQYSIYEDDKLQAYVNDIGQALARNSHRSKLAFHFTVLDSPEVNAFALPGGYVYVTRGIMAYLNSEAELAGVIGHEIGHVTARHFVRQHSQSTATGLFGAILTAGTGVDLFSPLGQAIVRGYGRDHELEADRLGAEYLARRGYDPQNMIEVIGTLKDQEEYAQQIAKAEGREARAYHGVFATHPDNDQRLKEVISAAREFAADARLDANRDKYLNMIDGMVFGPSSREGVTRGNHFYHADLDFTVTAPANWRIENRPDRLLLISPQNNALLQLTSAARDNSDDPRSYLEQRLKTTNLSRGTKLQVQELNGYSAITQGKNPWGEGQLRYSVWFKGEQAFLFAAAADNQQHFADLDAQFIDIVNSFRSLTAAEKSSAQALRLQVISNNQRSYAELAKDSPLSHAEAQLRLLNGQYPNGEAGKQVKLIH